MQVLRWDWCSGLKQWVALPEHLNVLNLGFTKLVYLLIYLPSNPLSKARHLSILCWQPTFWSTGVCTAWLCTGCRCTARGVVLPHGTNNLRAMSLRFKACSAAKTQRYLLPALQSRPAE